MTKALDAAYEAAWNYATFNTTLEFDEASLIELTNAAVHAALDNLPEALCVIGQRCRLRPPPDRCMWCQDRAVAIRAHMMGEKA